MSGFCQGFKRTASGSIKKPPVESIGWCYTRCKEDTSYSFAWTIEGFRRKMDTFTNGQCITSNEFKVVVDRKETQWKLECFPNGKTKVGEDTVGAVSVFLYPVNSHAINRNFSFAIGFVNEDNSRVMKGKGEHCFRDNQNGWGWLKLVTHQTLKGDGRDGRPEAEKLLPNDSLNILCVMKFKGEDDTTSGTTRPTSISTTVECDDDDVLDNDNKGLLNLLETGDLADIEVKCGVEVFQCHSAILASRSDVFRAMLVNDMREKATKQINLVDIDPDIFKALLMYIYGGKITNFHDHDKSSKILKAADQYGLLGLKRRCEESLCSSLNIQNCLDHLITADLHNATKLKILVIKFVVENAQEVTYLPNWKEKLSHYPDIFTEVFSELANYKSGKKAKSDDISWSHYKPSDTELDFRRT
ncbi:speckle-type POZ protein B isoform X2 [Eurytemora carolleeae]|uniref:speckle-type POZ protein B isoform X2 n=1 Tax=Eurytemora carolleeae TaxID=1294199 RepID=UPI000C788C52|nr:speckle-type POZ protein B isoform X2 [Eurytemora carolleeae]|eukprot:XP_023326496.1 speckle-type POZ protein B-like isoform X2 [Eurytemora affinis]